ncbi:hypothetical protein, partial [Burkholderia cenocepacia]|uniref:hypothetical protein n=1 Tax=Burkholderia cenocepacia TaxID=95486 RepID=UPI0021F4E105
LGDLLDCLNLELIRVPLAAHTDLLGCHKLWLEDVYERLAGPDNSSTALLCACFKRLTKRRASSI